MLVMNINASDTQLPVLLPSLLPQLPPCCLSNFWEIIVAPNIPKDHTKIIPPPNLIKHLRKNALSKMSSENCPCLFLLCVISLKL